MASMIDRFFEILDKASAWGTVLAGAVAVVWIIMVVVLR